MRKVRDLLGEGVIKSGTCLGEVVIKSRICLGEGVAEEVVAKEGV